MKQKEYIGFESLKQLDSVLNELSPKRIFLVTGKDSYSSSRAEEFLAELLADYEVTRFSDFSSNPKAEDVKEGIELFDQVQPDTVIAVGGGSVIDIAKLVNFFATNGLEPVEYFKTTKNKLSKPKPLIAIPTTAGSGSEATSFAVLYIDKEKFSVDNEFILPDFAIVDPTLVMSLPKYVTATTGMDALCQAIESYWSINSNDKSKRFAKDAIELIMNNLVTAVNTHSSFARLAMVKAANLAGKAINVTRTTAPHSISYPMTSYFGIPHGHAVALTFSFLLRYNYGVSDADVVDERGAGYVREMIEEIILLLGAEDIDEAMEEIDKLMRGIGLETKLRQLGIEATEDIEMIIEMGLTSGRAGNNPRLVSSKALREIIYSIQ